MRKLDFDLILLKILFKSNLLSFIPWRNFPTKSRLNFIFFLYFLFHNLTFLPLRFLSFFIYLANPIFQKDYLFLFSTSSNQAGPVSYIQLAICHAALYQRDNRMSSSSSALPARIYTYYTYSIYGDTVSRAEPSSRIITIEEPSSFQHLSKSGALPIFSRLSGKCMEFVRKHFTM